MSLIKLWKEDLQKLAGRNSDELEFYAIHGHWLEQARETTPTCHPKFRE